MTLLTITKPQSAVFELKTLTPLYTGGIGQNGEQLHPSGLLGSIRHWSCLVAKALDDRGFEQRVWGKAGDSQKDTQAKGVAVRWDGSGLKLCPLPQRIQVNPNNKGWFFNDALTGPCRLTLTRRAISDADWQILLLALRIQIRHGMLGAKDQFGLGVVGCDALPGVQPLLPTTVARPAQTDTLWHTAFFTVPLTKPGVKKEEPERENWHKKIELGLGLRYALRHALRGDPDTPADKNLRHQMLGALNEHGSAVNVSAAYPAGNPGSLLEARVVVQLKPEQSEQRTKSMKNFNAALQNPDLADNWRSGKITYQWGGNIGDNPDRHHFKTLSEWVNHLAGVPA